MENQQEKYINPLTDFGFKKLFGTEPNKNLLIDFLNQILPDSKIKDLSYVSTEYFGKTAIERKAVFDLSCIGENDERFIVEMQKAKQNYFKDRSVFYASFPIQEQAIKGEWDYQLNPVYSVGVLDFTFDEHKKDDTIIHTVSLKNQHCEEFYRKLKFVYIELPKFTKTEEELETHFDKWLYIKERAAYDASLKAYRDINNIVTTARDDGIEIGEKKNRDFGIAHIFDVKLNYDLLMGFLEVMHDDPIIKEKPVIGNLFPLKFIHIDLPKFTKTEAELETHLDKWFYAYLSVSLKL